MLKNILYILSLTSWYFCATLYEDQVGRFDWHKKFIGTPTSIYTFNSDQELLTQTDLNIISSIHLKNSSINWRFEVQQGEHIIGIEENNQLFLTSSKRSRNHIYAYSLKTGDLLWEQTTPLNERPFSVYLEYPNIYHIQNQQSLSKGSIDNIKWNWILNLNKDQGSILKIASIKGEKENTLLLFTQLGNQLQLLIVKDAGDQYEMSNANTIHTFKGDSPIDSCMFYDSKDKLDVLIFKSADELIITKANSLTPKSIEINHKNDYSMYKMSCPDVYSKGSNRQLLENTSLVKTSSDDTIEVVTLNIDYDSGKLLVKDSATLDAQANYLIKERSIITHTNAFDISLPKYGSIEKIFPTSKEEAIIVTRDGSFHKASKDTTSQYKLLWSRDESLSKAEETLILEFSSNTDNLLVSNNEIQNNKNSVSIFTAYYNRFKWHCAQFKRAFFSFVSSPLDAIINFHPNLLLSGTHKLLIFINNDGKISALNSQNSGEKIWDQYLDLPEKSSKLESAHIINLPKALKNTESHSGAPILVLRYSFKSTKQKLFALDGWTGELLDKKKDEFLAPSGLSIVDIKPLPLNHPKLHCKLLGLVDSNSQVHFYPSVQNENIKELVQSDLANNLYYYKVENSSINGYKLSWSPESQTMINQSLWNINLPKGQKIYKYEFNSGIDQMASPGKALGDRSVLYKYLNPNLISLIIQPSNGVGMNLLLIDAVDGSTIHQVSHKDALLVDNLSAHQILYENILVYSYQTENDIKFVVSELYEPDNQPNYEITSIDRSSPKILSSSFTYTHLITSIGFTKTNMGITSKEILVSLASNQIQAIPKSQLDPRRPLSKLSAHDQEEGLVVYKPSIPVIGKSLITYYLDVANIRQIKSNPSEYESTTLILANGQDIYFSLRHPSNLFDVLSEDFSKLSLMLTLLGLIAGILVVKPLVKSKNLKERWI